MAKKIFNKNLKHKFLVTWSPEDEEHVGGVLFEVVVAGDVLLVDVERSAVLVPGAEDVATVLTHRHLEGEGLAFFGLVAVPRSGSVDHDFRV